MESIYIIDRIDKLYLSIFINIYMYNYIYLHRIDKLYLSILEKNKFNYLFVTQASKQKKVCNSYKNSTQKTHLF